MGWKYNEESNKVNGLDNGNCWVLKAVPYGSTSEEVKQNGYLYAASPELLGACKKASLSLGYYLDFHKSKQDYAGMNAILLLHEAIKKAENQL